MLFSAKERKKASLLEARSRSILWN